MKQKIKPIKNLYFEFIQNSELDGRMNAQEAAIILADDGLIALIPHKTKPSIEHYQATESLNAEEVMDSLLEDRNG